MTIQLTPAERALLQGVAIPDLPVGALPSIKLLQTNSPELLNANDNEMFLEGSIAGGFVAPHREGRAFLPSPPGFHFQIFGWDKLYNEYEKRADGTDGRPVDKHPDKPQDAHWLDAGVPKPGYYRANGNRIVERSAATCDSPRPVKLVASITAKRCCALVANSPTARNA